MRFWAMAMKLWLSNLNVVAIIIHSTTAIIILLSQIASHVVMHATLYSTFIEDSCWLIFIAPQNNFATHWKTLSRNPFARITISNLVGGTIPTKVVNFQLVEDSIILKHPQCTLIHVGQLSNESPLLNQGLASWCCDSISLSFTMMAHEKLTWD